MRRAERLAFATLAVTGFALCAALGARVSGRTPSRLDARAVALRGAGVPAAVVFTELGLWPALTSLSVALVAAASLGPGGEARARTARRIVASHVLSQVAIARLKLRFRRVRPDYWLVREERDTSYPSGHASTAVTFYAAAIVVVAGLPAGARARVGTEAALLLCVAGIPWSRLALGAHYPTDVLGGALFGTAWTSAAVALGVLTISG